MAAVTGRLPRPPSSPCTGHPVGTGDTVSRGRPGALSFKERPRERMGPEPRKGTSSREQTRQCGCYPAGGGSTATQPTVLAPQWPRGDWIPRSQLRIHLEALTRCRPAVLRLRTRSAAELRVARPSPRPSLYRQERAGAAAGPARRGGSGALRALARPAWPRTSAWHLARV